MIRKVFKNYIEATDFLRVEKGKVYSLIVTSIAKCLDEGLKSIIVAEFLLTDEDITFRIEMTENDWHETLHLALYHFEEVEEYEKCKIINALITRLYG